MGKIVANKHIAEIREMPHALQKKGNSQSFFDNKYQFKRPEQAPRYKPKARSPEPR